MSANSIAMPIVDATLFDASQERCDLKDLYRSEATRFSVFTPEQELKMAQRIERHLESLLKLLVHCPQILTSLFESFRQVEQGCHPLNTLLYAARDFGSTPIEPEHPTPVDAPLDINWVRGVFQTLERLQEQALESLLSFGRTHPTTQKAFEALGLCFAALRFHPSVLKQLELDFVTQLKREPATQSAALHQAFLEAKQAWKSSKDAFIEANLRLVMRIARTYAHHPSCDVLDVIQAGNIGLIKALERFDYHRGTKFSTSATHWIRQAMMRSLSDEGRLIRLPVYFGDFIRRCKITKASITQARGRAPTNRQLAQKLHEPLPKVELALQQQEPLSLQAPRAEEEISLEDLIVDESATEGIAVATEAALKQALERVLVQLSTQEAAVIRLRFGLSEEKEGQTVGTIASQLKLSPERVRQIEQKALSKLRLSKDASCLRAFL